MHIKFTLLSLLLALSLTACGTETDTDSSQNGEATDTPTSISDSKKEIARNAILVALKQEPGKSDEYYQILDDKGEALATNDFQLGSIDVTRDAKTIDLYNDFSAGLMHVAGETRNQDALSLLAKHSEDNIRARAAKNIALPVSVQIMLMHDNSPLVRSYLAANKRLEQQAYNILKSDPQVDVRYPLAKNPSLTIEQLRAFVEDESLFVQRGLAKNRSIANSTELMKEIVEKSGEAAVVELLKQRYVPQEVRDYAQEIRQEQSIQDALQAE